MPRETNSNGRALIQKYRPVGQIFPDISDLELAVEKLVTLSINENQFAALVVFAWNNGLTSLKKSNLLKYVNQGRWLDAVDEFPKWTKDFTTIPKRRAEMSLFATPPEIDWDC